MFKAGKAILNAVALGAVVLVAAGGVEAQAQRADAQGADRPNVLVILVDDMGWSDIGPFGAADIATPHLDGLAERGVRMSNFHVSPICSPTRAMLLTGSDSHEVGLGNLVELVTPEQEGQPGYEGYLNDRAVTVAERLQDDGYWTVMAGKWRLGLTEPHSPAEANVLELAGGRAVHRGRWKAVLVTSQPKGLPVEQLPLKRWLLFDVVEDPGETTDLADERPDVLAELAAAYDAYAEEVGIVALPGVLDEPADR